MALNKYMHPRNIYRTPPDFGKLSKLFTEFSLISKVDVTGKVTIDFKDPNSLRILTKCLLKSDFSLDVEIPEDRLVPTLPLRLNYILWIEDLLSSIDRKENIFGIDIGTGACAIYPLLASVKNKWQMVGTEADDESIKCAEDNIKRNNLHSLIEVKKSSTSLIKNLLDEKTFDFCMCNPPFYSNIQELFESRNSARTPPKNGFTGSPQELITEGGELEFCRKLIKESKDKPNSILIFTTMVGHKYNLTELLQDLQAEGIKYTHTEFCQGRVTRWGLAWTYQNYDIYNLVPPREKLRKKTSSMVFLLPKLPNSQYDIQTAFDKIKVILNNLNIVYKVIEKRGNNILLDIIAQDNTWSNQRRKRRQMKKLQTSEAKKPKNDFIEKATSHNGNNNVQNSSENLIEGSVVSDVIDAEPKSHRSPDVNNEDYKFENQKQPLVRACLKLYKKEDNVFLEMEFIAGNGGKESLHQIVQFIKNNWI